MQEITLSRVHKVVYFVTTVSEVFCLAKKYIYIFLNVEHNHSNTCLKGCKTKKTEVLLFRIVNHCSESFKVLHGKGIP